MVAFENHGDDLGRVIERRGRVPDVIIVASCIRTSIDEDAAQNVHALTTAADKREEVRARANSVDLRFRTPMTLVAKTRFQSKRLFADGRGAIVREYDTSQARVFE